MKRFRAERKARFDGGRRRGAGAWGVLRARGYPSGILPLLLAVALASSAWALAIHASEPWQDVRIDSFTEARREMVQQQIVGEGIEDDGVVRAMEEVPRHLFLPEAKWDRAYAAQPVDLGKGQSLHQPYVVALMTQQLELDKTSKVLEIGTGTGYHSAILSRLAKQVFSVEIDPEAARQAKRRLDSLSIRNVHTRIGDGYQGWPEHAPYDAIILTAAPNHVPQPLLDQLRVGGKMVVPVGSFVQDLLVITKTRDGYEKRAMVPVVLPEMSGEARDGRP